MSTPYIDNDVEQALSLFRDHVTNQAEEAKQAREAEREVIKAKSDQLIPMRMLLLQLQKMEVQVTNTAFNTRKNEAAPPQPLRVSERPSSETWAPGISLMLDHPAVMEIAIPNPKDIPTKGVVIIHLASTHPEASLFERPFKTMGEAVKALAQFIALNTVSVRRMTPVADASTSPSSGSTIVLKKEATPSTAKDPVAT